jgi:Flp pilus assembly protein TadD
MEVKEGSMVTIEEHSRLRAIGAHSAFLAAFLVSFPPLSAQIPAAPPIPSQFAAPMSPLSTETPTAEQTADSLSVHQRYQAAIAAYQKAPPTAAVWNKMGIAYQMMFNLKDATTCYKESLKLDPHNASVLNNLGTIEDSLKEYGKAEKFYRKALKIDPQSALVLKNLGTNLLAQRKYTRGWDAYKQALAINPQIFQDRNSPQVQNPASIQERGAMNYYMALGCVRTGHTDCALQYLRLALDEGFTNPKKVESDIAFESLHDNPGFQELLASQSNVKAQQAR